MSKSANVQVSVRALSVATSMLVLCGSSQAWIGGFELADGYRDFYAPVQGYNAGQYGPNSGYGGSYTVIPDNTGLWQALAGGFTSGGTSSYATGHFANDRMWVNHGVGSSSNLGLVLTTGHEGWNGPALKYKYSFDSADFGGTNPASTGGMAVKVSFWSRGALPGPEFGGQVPDGYFGNEMTFEDTAGNVAFRLGLTQRAGGDRVTYWNGSTMFESSIVGGFSQFDRWDLTFDMAANTVSADYFHFATGTLHNLVVAQPMQNVISALTHFTYRSSPGVNNSKLNALDDFSFRVIPGPGAAGLLALGGLVAARRRR